MNNVIHPIANWRPQLQPALQLQQSAPLHFDLEGKHLVARPEGEAGGFAGLVLQALQGSSNQQQNSTLLGQQMLVSPDSVNVHTLTTEMSKAALSLSLAKAVIDRGLQAYRDIISLR